MTTYNVSIKQTGALSSSYTPENLYNSHICKPGTGKPFNVQMVESEIPEVSEIVVYAESSMSEDDGYTYPGFFGNPYEDIYFGFEGGEEREAFFLFKNVTVPQGATVTNAVIDARHTLNYAVSPTMHIYAENVDNANALIDRTDFLGLILTTAYTEFIPVFTVGRRQTSNFAAVINEVVGRAGWASGNSILIVFKAISAAEDDAVFGYSTYDSESYDPPQLQITYSI
jgi:hypothetical protein